MRIIIDTDLGTDIDDVFAMAFALRHPEFQVEAITTVTSYPVERARLARHLLDLDGYTDVPVAAGLALPAYRLEPKERQAYLERQPNHTQVADGVKTPFPRGAAVSTILELADRYPGEIGIVAIGPLTNIAEALMADPELPSKLKFISIMGGEFNRNHREYNVLMDPEASDLVYGCGAEIFLATWEVSRQVVLLPEHLDQLKETDDPFCQELLRCTELWWPYRKQKPGPVLYDIAPLLWLLDEAWFEVERMGMRVEMHNPVLRGVTYQDPAGGPELKVTTGIRTPEAARELMMNLLQGVAQAT